MTYLTAYRAGSGQYGETSRRPSNLPRPYQPQTKPAGANDNAPRPANDNVRRARALLNLSPKGRALLRKMPYVKTAANAYELWRLLNQTSSLGQVEQPMDGMWTLQTDCAFPLAITHYVLNSTGCTAPSVSTPCVGGQVVTGAVGINMPVTLNRCRLIKLNHSSTALNGSPRYTTLQYWWRNSSTTPSPVGQVFARQIPRAPKPQPVLNPNALPIFWPMPLPTPVPFALAPYRVNDPIGTTRSNGDPKPARRFARKPPGPGEKEVKLRATLPAGVLAIQKAGHAVTEGLDLLDSFYDALPKTVRSAGVFKGGKWWKVSPQEKVRVIWNNFDQLDWDKVIKNLAKNEIEDRILGRANASADRALTRSPIGRINRGIAF